jgi:hypothetical protein
MPSRGGASRAPGHRRRAKFGGRSRRHKERRGGCPCWGRSRIGARTAAPPSGTPTPLGTPTPRHRLPRAGHDYTVDPCEHRPSSRELLVQGTKCAASCRAPDLQVAAPGARGEAARALGTAVASARPACFVLGRRPAEPHGRPSRRARVSRRFSTRARRRRVCTRVWSRASSRAFPCR